MSSNQNNQKATSSLGLFSQTWMKLVALAVVGVIIFIGNRAFQSHLGREAIQNTGLTMYSLEEAIEKAQLENKMIFADMSAVWCPTCRKLDNEVFTDEKVKAALNEHYVFSRIDYESAEGEAFMQRYNVAGFPTLLILDNKGNKLGQLPLTFSTEKFVALITP
jgi:thiol:disulfide interchange protein